MKPSYILPTAGLSTDQVKLGRLITNIWSPANTFHDPPTVSYSPNVHNVTHYSSKLYHRSGSQSSVSSKLSKLFGINSDRSSEVFLKIEAESTTTQTLSNYSDLFKSMWHRQEASSTPGTEGTRQWIQDRLVDDEEVYMIVGITTVTDATVTVVECSTSTTAYHAGIPISEIASLAQPALATISALDVMIAMTVGRFGKSGGSYEVKGTNVVAVQYCKVKVGKWWKGKGAEAKLSSGEIAWEWFIGRRSRAMSPICNPRDQPVVVVSLAEPVNVAQILGEDEEGQGGEDGQGLGDDGVESFTIEDAEIVF
jgi:hypothetical protein